MYLVKLIDYDGCRPGVVRAERLTDSIAFVPWCYPYSDTESILFNYCSSGNVLLYVQEIELES